jgi:methionyl-tRNA formyltransferase
MPATTGGVSIMRLTAGLDSGPVCLSRSLPIARDTCSSLAARRSARRRAAAAGARRKGRGPLGFVEQDEAGATYAEKIAADRLLDPARPAGLERVVRAEPHRRACRCQTAALGVHEAALATPGRRGRLGARARRAPAAHLQPGRWSAQRAAAGVARWTPRYLRGHGQPGRR